MWKFAVTNSTKLNILASIILQKSTEKLVTTGYKVLQNQVRKCEGDIKLRDRAWLLHREGVGEDKSSLDVEGWWSSCMENKTWEFWCF
jgi:hypothetical protein